MVSSKIYNSVFAIIQITACSLRKHTLHTVLSGIFVNVFQNLHRTALSNSKYIHDSNHTKVTGLFFSSIYA